MTSRPSFPRPRYGAAWAALLALPLAVAAPGPAHANIPDPSLCTFPSHILLVGVDGSGASDPAGACSVVLKSIAGTPLDLATVVFDFSACPDLKLAAQQPYPGLTVSCSARTVTVTADVNGVARLGIVGGASNPGGAPGAGFQQVKIFANGVFLGYCTAGALDENGYDGLGAADLAAWVGDYLAGAKVGRSDFDGNGALDANDLAVWVQCFLAAHSPLGAGSLPGGVCP